MIRKDFKGNIWRELCAKAVEQNCGYSSGYHDRAALSWNVAVDWGVMDFDTLLPIAMGGDYGPGADAVIDADLLEGIKAEWDDEDNQSQRWMWIIKDMQRSVSESAGYNQLRPEIARRYGLPGSEAVMPLRYKRRTDECAYYPAGKPGWMKVNPFDNILQFDVECQFMGRQGKHLCLVRFEGQRLDVTSDSLAETIREADDRFGGDTAFTNDWCQKLLAFIHECDLMFTRENVKSEFEYQQAFRLGQELTEAADKTAANAKEAAERQAWAERDVMTKG